nr:hypothetical protein CFP56_76076 [Quercus suber]
MEAKVCVLIDAENGEWKADLIWEVFLEHEADSILSIPLSTLLPVDKLVWAAAANGKFSVKSAYNLARSGEKKDRGESSDSSIMKRFRNFREKRSQIRLEIWMESLPKHFAYKNEFIP